VEGVAKSSASTDVDARRRT